MQRLLRRSFLVNYIMQVSIILRHGVTWNSSDNWSCERLGMKLARAHDDISFIDVITFIDDIMHS